MTTLLQRLLKYPHSAVFDKDPVGELAFTLRHPEVSTWSIAEGVFTATAGEDEFTYDLRQLTVGQLASLLQADGFVVGMGDSSILALSAMVLVEASGSEANSNGDRIMAFTSLLWVMLSSYAIELGEAGRQVREALRQMVITQAEGEWLDLWGALYAQARLEGETDAAYAPRIPREAFRIRCNAHAIELAIRDATGYDVRIEEPWKLIFRLDQSLLSGPDRFYDGEFYGPHLIQPVTRDFIDWPAVLAIIERNKAAGIMVLGPQRTVTLHMDVSAIITVHSAMTLILASPVRYEDRALLDYGEISDVSLPNHPARFLQERRYVSHLNFPAIQWGAPIWGPDLTWLTSILSSSRHIRDFRVHTSGSAYIAGWQEEVIWAGYDGTWNTNSPVVGVALSRSA